MNTNLCQPCLKCVPNIFLVAFTADKCRLALLRHLVQLWQIALGRIVTIGLSYAHYYPSLRVQDLAPAVEFELPATGAGGRDEAPASTITLSSAALSLPPTIVAQAVNTLTDLVRGYLLLGRTTSSFIKSGKSIRPATYCPLAFTA